MRQEVYFENIREQIIKHIKEAKFEIKIAVAWFTDERIITELLSKKLNGVNITIIIYNDHINKKDLFKSLYYEGTKIYLSKKLMHNKFCIIDNDIIINGSFNWTLNANSNRENIQISYSNLSLVKKFDIEFSQIKLDCINISQYFEKNNTIPQIVTQSERDFLEFFRNNYSKYSYPYLFDAKEIVFSLANEKLSQRYSTNINVDNQKVYYKLPKAIYFVKDFETAKRIIKYFFLAQSKYSLLEILKLNDESFYHFGHDHFHNPSSSLISIFSDIPNIVSDSNNIITFDNIKSHTLITEYKYKNYLLKVDKSGKIDKMVEFNQKVLPDKYLYLHSEKSYIVDNEFNINYFTHKIIKKLPQNLFLFEKEKRYGICNLENKILTQTTFLDYKEFADYMVFIEEYILSENGFLVKNYYKKRENIGMWQDHKEHIFQYDKKAITSINYIKKEDYNKSKYYFISDNNYKYKDFYTYISKYEFKNKLKLRVDRETREINSFSTQDFNELKLLHESSELCQKAINRIENYRLTHNTNYDEKYKNSCYIATMVYGDYNHSEVLFLRDFRDTVLSKSVYGQKFIKWYYKNSPQFVNYVKDKPVLNSLTSVFIYILVFLLKKSSKK